MSILETTKEQQDRIFLQGKIIDGFKYDFIDDTLILTPKSFYLNGRLPRFDQSSIDTIIGLKIKTLKTHTFCAYDMDYRGLKVECMQGFLSNSFKNLKMRCKYLTYNKNLIDSSNEISTDAILVDSYDPEITVSYDRICIMKNPPGLKKLRSEIVTPNLHSFIGIPEDKECEWLHYKSNDHYYLTKNPKNMDYIYTQDSRGWYFCKRLYNNPYAINFCDLGKYPFP